MITLVETDYWTHIEYFAYRTYPITFPYTFVLNVHYVSDSIEVRKQERERRMKMFKNVERMIISKEYTKFNIEYVLIKAKTGIVWELMLNMKSFNKLVKVLSDDIDYEGKTCKKEK